MRPCAGNNNCRARAQRTRRLRRRRHSRRRPAAHLRRHGLQLSARQHRRHARPPAQRRGREIAVRHWILPRRRAAPRRQRAGRRSAGAPDDRKLRGQGQQGHQDRGPGEVAAQRRARERQELRPVGARRGQALSHRAVLRARQVLRRRRCEGRRSARQQGQGCDRHPRRQAGAHPADQHRRQQQLCRRRAARPVAAAHAELVVVVPPGRPLCEGSAHRGPGDAALVLHGPRLRRLRDHLQPGRDRAGEGRHLRHGQRARGRGATAFPT